MTPKEYKLKEHEPKTDRKALIKVVTDYGSVEIKKEIKCPR